MTIATDIDRISGAWAFLFEEQELLEAAAKLKADLADELDFTDAEFISLLDYTIAQIPEGDWTPRSGRGSAGVYKITRYPNRPGGMISVPTSIERAIDPDVRFTPELTDEGLLYRPGGTYNLSRHSRIQGGGLLTVPARITNKIDPDLRFTVVLTDDGVLYRPFDEDSSTDVPAWAKP